MSRLTLLGVHQSAVGFLSGSEVDVNFLVIFQDGWEAEEGG